MSIDLESLRGWIGRTETCEDQVTAAPLAALSATLDRDDPVPLAGYDAPPLAHWMYFTPVIRHSEIGVDGHAKRGRFLPPVELPRRMWAGGRFEFFHPLRVGDDIVRVSRVIKVDGKDGRTGPLVFVTVRHEILNAHGLALSEEHDIVYRDSPGVDEQPVLPTVARSDDTFHRRIEPDPVLLFRYSALTFNGHRIHYDRSYVTEVEGYPGLIVHGPLIATMLLDLLRREFPGAIVRRFSFRAVGPLFDMHPFDVCGAKEGERRFALWARNVQGHLAMQASAEVA